MENKKKLFIGLGVSLVVLIIAGVVLSSGLFGNPKVKIVNAFESLEDEAKVTVDKYFEGLNLVEFYDNYAENGKISADGSISSPFGMNYSLKFNQNLKNRQAGVVLSAKLPMGVNLDGDLRLLNDKLYIDVPVVSDKGPFSFNLSNFGSEFVNSQFNQENNLFIDDDAEEEFKTVKIHPFEGSTTPNELQKELKSYVDADIKTLVNNMKIEEKTDGKVGDYSTTDYKVTIKEEDVKKVLESYDRFNRDMALKKAPFLETFQGGEYLNNMGVAKEFDEEEFSNISNCTISLDSNDKLRQIKIVPDEGDTVFIKFLGENSILDNMEFEAGEEKVMVTLRYEDINTLTITTPGNVNQIFKYDKAKKEFSIGALNKSVTDFGIKFKDVEPGKKYTVDFMLPGTGVKFVINFDSNSEDVVQPEKTMDILNATPEEYNAVKGDIEKFIMTINSFMYGGF